jgi:hypothetical protein
MDVAMGADRLDTIANTFGQTASRRAMLIAAVGAMVDLNELMPADRGWELSDAVDINDAGQIVGQGWIGGGVHGCVRSPSSL